MPAQPARPSNLRPQAAGQGHYGGYPATGQHAGYQRPQAGYQGQQAGYQGQPAGYGGVPQAAQQPQRPGQQATNPLARYDVFSAQFDASAFQKAHQQVLQQRQFRLPRGWEHLVTVTQCRRTLTS